MRLPRAVVLLTLTLLLAVTGCSRSISGSAVGDLNPPLVELTEDQFGIRAGFEDAPVQLELYTEPQCTHCADLQRDFGDEFAYYIGTGPARDHLPAADVPRHPRHRRAFRAGRQRLVRGGHPRRRSPVSEHTTGRQFQRFVEQLWANQQPGGTGPERRGTRRARARRRRSPAFQAHADRAGRAREERRPTWPTWSRRTSSSSTRSTRSTPARQRFSTSTPARRSTSTTTTGCPS